jgi:hypothetical protein
MLKKHINCDPPLERRISKTAKTLSKYGLVFFHFKNLFRVSAHFLIICITFTAYIKIHLNVKPTEPRGNGGRKMRASGQNKAPTSQYFFLM